MTETRGTYRLADPCSGSIQRNEYNPSDARNTLRGGHQQIAKNHVARRRKLLLKILPNCADDAASACIFSARRPAAGGREEQVCPAADASPRFASMPCGARSPRGRVGAPLYFERRAGLPLRRDARALGRVRRPRRPHPPSRQDSRRRRGATRVGGVRVRPLRRVVRKWSSVGSSICPVNRGPCRTWRKLCRVLRINYPIGRGEFHRPTASLPMTGQPGR
jgi:hypothetical protein